MSTFHTSKGTRCQHVSPKYQSAPHRQHPARREHIHGRIRPANDNSDRSRAWFWIQFAIYAVCAAYALDLWIVK